MFNRVLFIILFINSLFKVTAQLVPGEWKDFLPYHNMNMVALSPNKIYCSSPNSLFYYDLSDKSINHISKVQGLSEVEISTIAYALKKNMLIIAYANSNIDILENNKISNLPYIKNKTTIPDRRILSIMVVNNIAYLSCGFGIAVLDLDKKQIKDTYYPGNNGSTNKVNHTCTDGQYIYAATSSGIYKALLDDPFLADFSRWTQLNNFPNYNNECRSVEYVTGRLFALYNSNALNGKNDSVIYLSGNVWSGLYTYTAFIYSINASNNKLFIASNYGIFSIDVNFNYSKINYNWTSTFAVSDENSNIWISDGLQSLIKIPKEGKEEIIEPNSPLYADVYKMAVQNGNFWSVAGSKEDNWAPDYNNNGAQSYIENIWKSYNSNINPQFQNVKDLINVVIDPLDDEIVYMASWFTGGLIQYNHGNFNFFNNTNSSLQPYFYPSSKKSSLAVSDTMYKLCGLSFDNSHNLWITNSFVRKPLLVYTADHKWNSYYLGNSAQEDLLFGDVVATSWGHKWIVIPRTTSVFVFDDNNTIDNASDNTTTIVSFSNIESLIKSNYIYCIAEDRQGIMWVGTDAGPVRFTTPQDAFNETGTSPQKIRVAIVRGKTDATFLLETERINAIAIDGANRKWFGTQSTGAYLISENDNQIEHFTSENSPLLSNTILDIKIDQKSGVVYFATDKGLISYRGFATEGVEEFGKVYVYPNPVKENYTGNIIVTGLIENTNVKITDISGNLVYETKSLGGQAIWNGKNLLGKRVSTGVYLVFSSNSDGSKTHATKLLFIH